MEASHAPPRRMRVGDDPLIQQVSAYSIIQPPRLFKMKQIAEKLDVSGALVACGVMNGGAAALLAAAAPTSGEHRDVWLFDDWDAGAGASKPNPTVDGAHAYEKWAAKPYGWYRGEPRKALDILEAVGHPRERVHIVEEWPDSLQGYNGGPIALLHVDADLYHPTKASLEALWPHLVMGGVVIIDDFGTWPGCHLAVHDFLGYPARVKLRTVDAAARWFIKDRE